MRRHAHGKLGRSIGSRADTSDVVQNALVQVSDDIAAFRGSTEAEWVGWLRCILAGHAAKIRRYHHFEKRAIEREEVAFEKDSLASSNSARAVDSDDVQLAQLLEAIYSLSDQMREVVQRRVLEQQSYERIAHDLNITPGNARVLLTRATRKLKDVLRPSSATLNS